MSDDTAGCVLHEWALAEIQAGGRGLAMLWRCMRCGAESYEPSGLDRADVEGVPPADGLAAH